MKMFQKLGERTVKISGANGTVYEVKKLGVGDIDTYHGILNTAAEKSVDRESEIAAVEAARPALLELAKKVMPEKLHDDLQRFSYIELSELVGYLLFGSESEQELEKKTE